jgi:hypothetical protein
VSSTEPLPTNHVDTVLVQFLVWGALAACAVESIPSAHAQKPGTPFPTKFSDPNKPPAQGTWKALCPQLVLPTQPGHQTQTSMKTIAPNGTIVGSAAMPGGGWFMTCPPRGSRS